MSLSRPSKAFWRRLAGARPRVLLLDYDGTLAPFRVNRGRARPAPGVLPALRRVLESQAAEVVIVSGRPAEEVASLLDGLDVEIFGAHGWERRRRGGALERRPLAPEQAEGLEEAAHRAGQAGIRGPRLERKYASIAAHVRGLEPVAGRRMEERARRLFAKIAPRAGLEVRGFDGGVELRATGADKGTAVQSALERLGRPGFAVYLGDDLTDEDAFRAVSKQGAGVLVRAHERPTAALFRLSGPAEVVQLLDGVAALAARGGRRRRAAPAPGMARKRPAREARLVVVSNRLPEASVGGLVTALKPALERAPRSLWFGWSGRSVPEAEAGRLVRGKAGTVETLGMDLAEGDVEGHYYGFCNRALWPLCHVFPERAEPRRADYDCFVRVNALFARALRRRLTPTDLVWAHDYHLLTLGQELRRRGFAGRIGFFLHIPFPPSEVFQVLPAARELLEALLQYDLVGFHTEGYMTNYARAVRDEFGGERPEGGRLEAAGRVQRIGVYPIGIDPAPYQTWASEDASVERGKKLRETVRGRKIILGVDRLDYTKGIPERLRAFGRLLEIAPRFRKRTSFIQISAPSRERIPEYARQRRAVEELVGRLNGEFGEEDWVPVRYLFRPYSQQDLAAFYREADVCLVSPLRDGMNLVAKEYVAAQTGDPGVLVLSRFAGAAEELREALIVNPYDLDGVARALAQALEMPFEERQRRQTALLRQVTSQTAARWAESFERDLRAT